jgi:hypothetical protein
LPHCARVRVAEESISDKEENMLPTNRKVTQTALGLALAAAMVVIYVPQALARESHVLSPGKRHQARVLLDGRSPDTKDAAAAAHRISHGAIAAKTVSGWPPVNGAGWDGRSPDTKDAAGAAHSSSSR